jgi:hypothetical protein
MCVIGSMLFSAIVLASASIAGVITYIARIQLFAEKMSTQDRTLLIIIFASIFGFALVTISPINLITGKRKEKEDGF